MSRPRAVVMTNIVAPYRLPALGELAQLVDLSVLFCAERGAGGCDWRLPQDYPFRHRIVGGLRYQGSGSEYHLSPRILSAIARARPQVVVSGGYSIPTLYAAAYCALTGCRLVIFCEGTSHSERQLSGAQMLARRLLLGFADACVAPSNLAAQRFLELGMPKERVFVSPYTTDVTRFWAVAKERRAPRPTGLRLIAVSRLVARKGIDRLLTAFRRASEAQAGLELTVVGAGSEGPRLRRLAAELGLDDVEFLGFVDQPELPSRFRNADTFAFPTLDDPFGIVLLEACASGLPAIASRHAGATPELMQDGVTGFVVDPDDIDAMAGALIVLARDPEGRDRMGRAAYEATLTRTPAVAAAGYAAAIERALGSRRRAGRTPAWA